MPWLAAWLAASPVAAGAAPPPELSRFTNVYCVTCHDEDVKRGDLDVANLAFDASTFSTWVTIYDRVSSDEMPPKTTRRPEASARTTFLTTLERALRAAERGATREGRASLRRLNRYEYENALQDLLDAPWLRVRDQLPEDREAHRFNKSGESLDVSHVQLAAYLTVARGALTQLLTHRNEPIRTQRLYAREQPGFLIPYDKHHPERSPMPLLGSHGQPDVLSGKVAITGSTTDPKVREEQAFGVTHGSYRVGGMDYKFDQFVARAPGRYRVRLSAYSFWAGPGTGTAFQPGEGVNWWIPDRARAAPGHRDEPVTLYAYDDETQRRLGGFDVSPTPSVHELEVVLERGETILVDASRLYTGRPPNKHRRNPLATREGMPGVAYRWLEVEGPLPSAAAPSAARPFGDLPLRTVAGGGVEVVSTQPARDHDRLVRAFATRAFRRPPREAELRGFIAVGRRALAAGDGLADALIAAYTAVLCAPGFLWIEEQPGRLDETARATRLSLFLWNSLPDTTLRELARRGELRRPDVLRAQIDRLLDAPQSDRFVDAFLAYWLDLRKIDATNPDATLYSDYFIDTLLFESAIEETHRFFEALVHDDLPARNLVSSDFAFVNERLAAHYGLPPVVGTALRKVTLPPDSPRGGLLAQASILKTTANGTTTSPVKRGAWVMERIVGMPPPPPPPNLPSIEPDIRGATTVREQLELHRKLPSCARCHARFDGVGFALESFDVFGGWRDRYRALDQGQPVVGYGKNGQPFAFRVGPKVASNGQILDGRTFEDLRGLERLLLTDERQIARSLVRQLVVFATGAPVRFSDRPEVERILDQAAPRGYGVRSLIYALVDSALFGSK